MQVFPEAVVLTNKPRFGVMKTYCVSARLGGKEIALGKTRISAIIVTLVGSKVSTFHEANGD